MAIHWQIKFKSLRAGTDYTVNIYDAAHAGQPVVLKGGAEPFVTQEDDSDDEFQPVRTQSGYLRIVDDGLAADGETPFDWKELLPLTNTDRPVTLTTDDGTVHWQGFMQVQNFGGTLYGNPQEREFPVQCPLSVLDGIDINHEHVTIANFGFLLNHIVSQIPIEISSIVIQGGQDAQQWLLKRIDWMNFADVGADGSVTARYSLYECLEDMCRFWGWTARTWRQTLILTCADDNDEQDFLSLSLREMLQLAGGTVAGTTGTGFRTVAIGDIFASTDNTDYMCIGAARSLVTADGNPADTEVIACYDDSTIEAMKERSWIGHYNTETKTVYYYTEDLLAIDRPLMAGKARNGYGSFNLMRVGTDDPVPMCRIARSFGNKVDQGYISLQTTYEHIYDDGFISLTGKTYVNDEEYTDVADLVKRTGGTWGRRRMYARLGIGASRSQAKWWDGALWQDASTVFLLTVGNEDDQIRSVKRTTVGNRTGESISATIPTGTVGMAGLLFLDLLGSDDMPEQEDGNRAFDIEGLCVTFERTKTYTVSNGRERWAGARQTKEYKRADRREYKSANDNRSSNECAIDCIFASDNDMGFGYGVLANPDNTLMKTADFGGRQCVPEQHLADRVTAYWATAKRKIEAELRTDANATIPLISPLWKATLDGTAFHPIGISREWRDDVSMLTLLEI